MLLGGVQRTSILAREKSHRECSVLNHGGLCRLHGRSWPQPAPQVTPAAFAARMRSIIPASSQTIQQTAISYGHKDQGEEGGSSEMAVEEESLAVLEWPAVCKQVACFCGTVMAAQRLAAGQLPMGNSRNASEALLQQTEEALELALSVAGVYDITPALAAASEPGVYLNAAQLQGVADTLDAMLRLRATVMQASSTSTNTSTNTGTNTSTSTSSDSGTSAGSRSKRGTGPAAESWAPPPQGPPYRYPALATLALQRDVSQEQAVLAELRRCIKAGSVVSSASEALERVRTERQANAEALRKLMDEQARVTFQKKASDSRAVSSIRGRFCIGIKAGRQSDLPKGSVKLGASQTGATQYWEPAPAIPLNNAATVLGEQEARESARVLLALSSMIAQHAPGIISLLECSIHLDVAGARAAHARWLRAVRPILVGATASSSSSPATTSHLRTQPQAPHRPGPKVPGSECDGSRVWVPGALHPLLLERALPPLPSPPSLDDNRFERNFAAPGTWEVKRSVFGGPALEGGAVADEASSSTTVSPAPQALDLRLPDVAVVAVTGPNTGGKTVTLKTVGLMALMAKAGLFVPVDPAAVQRYGQPAVAWFGSVLADIGDAQNLQQSLSTFSGHVRRIKRVLAAAGSDSLVLLDEVGSGTDPVEGAALARAILDKLAGLCPLTVATTHHAELKYAAAEDGRYTNVAMEFNELTLRPTYRLLWGAAGDSNALDIAQLLGFDGRVVADAREVAAATLAEAAGRAARMAATAESLQGQLEDMRGELEEAVRAKAARHAELTSLRHKLTEYEAILAQLNRSPREIVEERDGLADALEVALAGLEAVGGGDGPALDAVKSALSELEALIPEHILAANNKAVVEEGDPVEGDTVFVEEYNASGTVLRVLPGNMMEVSLMGALGLLSLMGKKSRGTVKVHKSKLLLQQRAKPLVVLEEGAEGAWEEQDQEQEDGEEVEEGGREAGGAAGMAGVAGAGR